MWRGWSGWMCLCAAGLAVAGELLPVNNGETELAAVANGVRTRPVGEDVTLPCRHAPFSVANLQQVQWVYEDEQAGENKTLVEWSPGNGTVDNVPARMRVDREDFNLTISQLMVNDSGRYVCVGTERPQANSTQPGPQAFAEGLLLDIHATPTTPEVPEVEALGPHQIQVSWQPNDLKESIQQYIVMVETKDMGEKSNPLEKEVGGSLNSTTVDDLWPYTFYYVTVLAKNGVGSSSPSQRSEIRTWEDMPGAPKIFQFQHWPTSIQVKWQPPEHPNGIITGYTVYWSDGLHQPQSMKRLNMSKSHDPYATHRVQHLEPCKEYHFWVSGNTTKGEGNKSQADTARTDIPAPQRPVITNLTSNGSSSVLLTWTRPGPSVPCSMFRVDHYIISYQAAYASASVSASSSSSSSSAGSSNDPGSSKPKDDQHTIHYSFTDHQQDSYQHLITDLTPNSAYVFKVRGASLSPFNRNKVYEGNYSAPMKIKLEDDSHPQQRLPSFSRTAGIIGGIICTLLLLIFALVIFIFMRRYMNGRYSFIADPDGNNLSAALSLPEAYNPEECARESITITKFAEHVGKLHADSDLGFSQEYEDINQNTRIDLTAHHSSDSENKHKNRYINIVAYDHSRVILKPVAGKAKSDYINANFVDGYNKPRAYIAAQGPLPGTFGDFWRMVWEQNSSVVVMITNLTERGRRKCDQYWPTEGEHQYEGMQVKLLTTYVMAHYTIRVFTLKHLKLKKKVHNERVIVQYHYTDWPDHGVPDYTLPSLAFISKSAATNPPATGPIIVHCSAGVGRTGTYIVIDSMMQQIKDKSTINIYGFLSHIRNQRNYLVQTEDQYIFIHDALLEYIESGETEVKVSCLSSYIHSLHSGDDNGCSPLSKQFELIKAFKAKDHQLSAAMLIINQEKNRSSDILPVDLARVKLPTKPGVEGSDYINASYVQGYSKNCEFIVTQHPLKSTVEDFWRMVWDQNSMTVVLLSPTDDQDYISFWPPREETSDCGPFKVSASDENIQLGETTRDFLLQSTQDDYECTTKIISTTFWPEGCTPLHGVFDLIHTVRNCHSQHEVEGPIIVVDRYGGKEAATFCALYCLYDQLWHEGCVDVYMAAKLFQLKRPGMLPNLASYEFLYSVMESLCKEKTFQGEREISFLQSNHAMSTLPSENFSNRTSLKRLSSRAETTM